MNGTIYLFSLGWSYSWQLVPAVNEFGSDDQLLFVVQKD